MGSTGKVKLGRHVQTGEYVALKFVRNNLISTNSSLYDKFRREIAVLKFIAATHRQLQSSSLCGVGGAGSEEIGVLKLYDVFDYENSTVLVLEYCNGGELFDRLSNEGCLPSDVILDYFQQLVYALSFCHRRGICHRDLKLENVLVAPHNRLKIADFGMASLTFPGSFLRTSCGSPQYCAPEVILGESYDGTMADIWSLGIILYAMTTGGLPFDDDNLQRLVMKIQAGAFYMPPEVPHEIADLISKMLIPDPSARMTLSEIKQSDWFNSAPCRGDVYVEQDKETMNKENEDAKEDEDKEWLSISNPDEEVVRQLVDLGLGDVNVVKLRLNSTKRCKEKDYYHVLFEFCSFIKSQQKQQSPSRRLQMQVRSKEMQVTSKDMAALCAEQQADNDENDNDNGTGDAEAELQVDVGGDHGPHPLECKVQNPFVPSDQVYSETIPVEVTYSVYAG